MSAKQLQEWRQYSLVEPFGYPELDAQMSYLRRTIVEAFGGKKKNGGHWTDNDFSLEYYREEAFAKHQRSHGAYQQPMEEMKEIMLSIAALQNKRHKQKKLHNRPPISKQKGK